MAIGGFNEDLTYEILLRLPVKSLLRFKTVCKRWFSIVSCRRFRLTHTLRIGSNATPAGIFLPKRPRINHEFEYEFLPVIKPYNPIPNIVGIAPFSDYPVFNIRSSSNGLLLMRSTSTRPNYQKPDRMSSPYAFIKNRAYAMIGDPDREYLVHNPTTKEFKPLVLPQHIKNSLYVNESLAFDPSKSPHYKVVFVYYNRLSKDFEIEIYSSETATFNSPALNPFTSVTEFSHFCGIYCNDAIHWTSYDKSSMYYFDLNTECLKELRLPRCMRHLGESGGHLLLVSGESCIVYVHEVKKDYSKWFLRYQVDLSSMINPKKLDDKYDVLSMFFNEEEDLIMVFVLNGYHKIYVCNFKEKPFNILKSFDGYRTCFWLTAHHYIETYACV